VRVVLLAQGSEIVASSRTRVFAYLPHVARAGAEADVLVWNPERFVARTQQGNVSILGHARRFLYNLRVAVRLARRAAGSDAVLVQKVVLPAWYLRLLRRRTGRLVFDYDDALYALAPGHERGVRGVIRRARVRRFAACLAESDAVLVENAPNREFAERHCRETVTITGPIDTERYRPAPPRPETGPVVIGWIGTPWTSGYLQLAAPALAELARRGRSIAVHLIGAAPWSFDGVPVRQVPWSLESEVAALATFDLGLMPLTDDPWARGKGGYKILQYMAMGIPTVASPVGLNGELVRDGVTGFLATDSEGWVRALDALVTDAEARRRMGAAARAEAVARYSLEHYAPIWLRALGAPVPAALPVAEAVR
jgi:glycosyltransferase involved in cell wall biosynthesis